MVFLRKVTLSQQLRWFPCWAVCFAISKVISSRSSIFLFCQSEIFKALERAKLMVGNRKESCYSRCGRTDKGVSATGQVAAESLLFWRVTQTPESNECLSDYMLLYTCKSWS
jgi:tRNA pseudouridine38/39 synthase